MEPIVSPIWFYLIGILPKVSTLCLLLSVLLGGVGILAFADYYLVRSYGNMDDKKTPKKHLYVAMAWLSLAFTLALICVLIPSKDTMYQMLIAAYATSDNIQYLEKNVVQFVMDTAEALAKAK